MELEQLKDMWKGQEAEQSPLAVQPLLGKKSRSPIAIMKRHLTIELIVVVILYSLVIAYFLLAHQGKFAMIATIYIVLAVLFFIYFFKKYRLLNSMECMACQVKSNLSKQVHTLEKYVRFYLLAGTVIVPVFLIFFYWFEYTYIPPDKTLFLLPTASVSVVKSISHLLLLMVMITIPAYYVNRWYVNKLYGKQVNRLKQMLQQMEDGSADQMS